MKEWGLEEALYNQRAIRDFTDEPVSDEDIHYLLDTAVKAPNGGNRQPWIFLVIMDEDARAMLGEWYLQSYEAYTERVRAMAARGVPESKADTDRWDKIGAFSRFQLEFQRAPVMILVCVDERLTSKMHPPDAPVLAMNSLYGSIFPAAQNILLACMIRGLGACPTALHSYFEDDVKKYFNVPDNFRTVCLITIGHTQKRYGPTKRIPAHIKTYWGRWGTRHQWEPKTTG